MVSGRPRLAQTEGRLPESSAEARTFGAGHPIFPESRAPVWHASSGFAAALAEGRSDHLGFAALAGVDGIFEIGRRLGGRDEAKDQPSGADRARHDQGRQLRRRCGPMPAHRILLTSTLEHRRPQFLNACASESRLFCAAHTQSVRCDRHRPGPTNGLANCSVKGRGCP